MRQWRCVKQLLRCRNLPISFSHVLLSVMTCAWHSTECRITLVTILNLVWCRVGIEPKLQLLSDGVKMMPGGPRYS